MTETELMRADFCQYLACPVCGAELKISHASAMDGDEVTEGELQCTSSHLFPITKGIPRFVSKENYASNFGFQWNMFRRTQLDSYSGHPISGNRFWAQSGWKREELAGKRVLDVGCGAGRFVEIALEAGAQVVALDYSVAVEACREYHREKFPHSLNVVQGDIYHLPFRPGQFDFVYCFGVLQHTPDVRSAILALARQHVPLLGLIMARAIPVANYSQLFPLTEEQLDHWAILDTYDWFGPRYDQPQPVVSLRSWFEEGGLADIEVAHPAHLPARGRERSERCAKIC